VHVQPYIPKEQTLLSETGTVLQLVRQQCECLQAELVLDEIFFNEKLFLNCKEMSWKT